MSAAKPWVLIIEDEPELVETLSERLQQSGYGVHSCDRVSTAVAMLRNQKFGCILLDLKLEQGTGEQVVAVLKADKTHPNFKTPILVMSGHLDRDKLQALGPQISGAMVKPFSKDELLQKIQYLAKA